MHCRWGFPNLYLDQPMKAAKQQWRQLTDLYYKSHNTPVPYPTMQHFVTEMCTIEFLYNHYTRHTFWSCLIRCANMKWIRRVLLKIQSGHDSVNRHRWTDGQGETSIPHFQLRRSGGLGWVGMGGVGGGRYKNTYSTNSSDHPLWRLSTPL